MAEPLYPLLALERLRMGTDGAGVTTLAASQGCPLRSGKPQLSFLKHNQQLRAASFYPGMNSYC